MDLINCGIDLHYKQSNFYFIDEITGKEFYRVIPTSQIQIPKMLDDLNDYTIEEKILSYRHEGEKYPEGYSRNRAPYDEDRIWRFKE